MHDYSRLIASEVARAAGMDGLDEDSLATLVTRPPSPEMGDFAFPCFTLAKTLRKSPAAIAADLAGRIRDLHVPCASAGTSEGSSAPAAPSLAAVPFETEAAGPYVNFRIDPAAFASDVAISILGGDRPFAPAPPAGRPVVLDFCSPNVAKPFSIGHLRSTVIGAALSRLASHMGHPVVRVNHLGDWGTQFGKVILAYRLWGKDIDLTDDVTNKLYELYVKFHEVAETDPSLEDQARKIFSDLEAGDAETRKLWSLFVEKSVEDIRRVCSRLGVEFDHFTGESFYNDHLEATFGKISSAGLVKESQGAMVVDLEAYGMPPSLLKKSDGATLYATRDLSAALYRLSAFDPAELLYVVGTEQSLHFRQLFKVLELMGIKVEGLFHHVNFGLYRFGNEKMSTRRGKVVFMEDVLDRAVEMAEGLVTEKNPGLPNRSEVARMVGIGAVVFGDLVNDRVRDVDFDWDKILSFEGDTGPYVQYSVARVNSIFRKSGLETSDKVLIASCAPAAVSAAGVGTHEMDLARELYEFPAVMARAWEEHKPHHIAKKALDIAKAFSRFYHNCPVLTGPEETRPFRLALSKAAARVMSTCLGILGVATPEEM